MTRQAGIWIDHKQAFVVFIDEGPEKTQRIDSGMEKHVRYSGRAAAAEGSADDQRDRQFLNHLRQYYDGVIEHLRGTESILILGPGEAKGELKKRLETKGLGGHIVGVETVDKMTDPQIVAMVRAHFQK